MFPQLNDAAVSLTRKMRVFHYYIGVISLGSHNYILFSHCILWWLQVLNSAKPWTDRWEPCFQECPLLEYVAYVCSSGQSKNDCFRLFVYKIHDGSKKVIFITPCWSYTCWIANNNEKVVIMLYSFFNYYYAVLLNLLLSYQDNRKIFYSNKMDKRGWFDEHIHCGDRQFWLEHFTFEDK